MLSKTVLALLVPFVVANPILKEGRSHNDDSEESSVAAASASAAPQSTLTSADTGDICDCRDECEDARGATNITVCVNCLDLCKTASIEKANSWWHNKRAEPEAAAEPAAEPAPPAEEPAAPAETCDCSEECHGAELAGDIILCMNCASLCHGARIPEEAQADMAAALAAAPQQKRDPSTFGPYSEHISPLECTQECDEFCQTADIAVEISQCDKDCKTMCSPHLHHAAEQQQKRQGFPMPAAGGAPAPQGGAAPAPQGGAAPAPQAGGNPFAGLVQQGGENSGKGKEEEEEESSGSTAGDIVQCACATDCMHTLGWGMSASMECAMECLAKCPTPGLNDNYEDN